MKCLKFIKFSQALVSESILLETPRLSEQLGTDMYWQWPIKKFGDKFEF